MSHYYIYTSWFIKLIKFTYKKICWRINNNLTFCILGYKTALFYNKNNKIISTVIFELGRETKNFREKAWIINKNNRKPNIKSIKQIKLYNL